MSIDVIVDGVTEGNRWSSGLEFDYANEESIYCRPLKTGFGASSERMPVPHETAGVRAAFLPPMSGLAAVEPKWEPGRVSVLLGEGQTAQVLRNLCHSLYSPRDTETWDRLAENIKHLFGARLLPPEYITERGEITMAYEERGGTQLDLSCSGRGLQQTLLLLAHLYANPGAVHLLDEPDAHLEILRRRQIYNLITDLAEEQGAQVVAASHSEILLNESAERDVVIAFVGKPHRIDNRGSQVAKSLKEIGFDHYYQAEQTGWILYLEGSTDLANLQAAAETLRHSAVDALAHPFVVYVGNNPKQAQRHFWGLREARPGLLGIAIFDRLDRDLPDDFSTIGMTWSRREIENYFCDEEVLLAYAEYDQPDNLFGLAAKDRRRDAMREAIDEVSRALETLGKPAPWPDDINVADDFLTPLFDKYFKKLDLPNVLRKSGYHVLARLMPKGNIAPEVVEKLDAIARVANDAKPA